MRLYVLVVEDVSKVGEAVPPTAAFLHILNQLNQQVSLYLAFWLLHFKWALHLSSRPNRLTEAVRF